jgi:hypothetical protein
MKKELQKCFIVSIIDLSIKMRATDSMYFISFVKIRNFRQKQYIHEPHRSRICHTYTASK